MSADKKNPKSPIPARLWPLLGLNFFMADMQSGIGPFIGVFLQAHGWASGLIGTAMTLGNVAGMAVTTPIGGFIDASNHKRAWVIVPGVAVVVASALILVSQNFWAVTASQIATSLAGAAIVPAVTGITLGLVKQKGFNRQNGRNQAFNHAGNMVGAAASGYLGWKYGYTAVFLLAAAFGAIAIACVLMIPATAIDNRAARGSKADDPDSQPSGFTVLARHKALLVLAVALAAFHLGNAAIIPLYGLAAVADGQAKGPEFVATTIVIAQAVMIVTSIVGMRAAEGKSYWPVMLASFLVLPVRGILAFFLTGWWGVLPVQILDGIGTGLQSVAVPGMVARSLNGTGRINLGQGAVITVQGIGGVAKSRPRRLGCAMDRLPAGVSLARRARADLGCGMGRLCGRNEEILTRPGGAAHGNRDSSMVKPVCSIYMSGVPQC